MTTPPSPKPNRTSRITALALPTARRLLIFSLLWFILTEGFYRDWLPAAAVIICATASSFWIAPATRRRLRLRPSAFLRFVPYFLWQSILGGFDVSRRALSPRMTLDPGLFRFQLQLQDPTARTLFIGCVSLLPGTASVESQEDFLVVHALDQSLPLHDSLATLQAKVDALVSPRSQDRGLQ
jgi:multicomponent Na+:H+ antiporter subunit E